MKALLDMPVSAALLDVLNNSGHQGVHAYQLGMSTASDAALLDLARQQGYVIITADLDFPRLLVLSMAAGPGLILFRGGNYSDAEMCNLLERVLKEVAADILENSICVVDQKRIRITQLPIIRKTKPR